MRIFGTCHTQAVASNQVSIGCVVAAGDLRELEDDVEFGSTIIVRSGPDITPDKQNNSNRYLLTHRFGLCRPVPGIGLGSWDLDKALFRILL